jgi:hypothetical protein
MQKHDMSSFNTTKQQCWRQMDEVRMCNWYKLERGEVCTGFWWGSLRERDHWGDPEVDRTIILRWIFRKWEGVVGTGWSGLRIGTGGGHL